MEKMIKLQNKNASADPVTVGLFSVGLCAAGVILGVCQPQKRKKLALWLSVVLFFNSLITLAVKLFTDKCTFCSEDNTEDEKNEDKDGFIMRIVTEE